MNPSAISSRILKATSYLIANGRSSDSSYDFPDSKLALRHPYT
jgi:hypothetical protein